MISATTSKPPSYVDAAELKAAFAFQKGEYQDAADAYQYFAKQEKLFGETIPAIVKNVYYIYFSDSRELDDLSQNVALKMLKILPATDFYQESGKSMPEKEVAARFSAYVKTVAINTARTMLKKNPDISSLDEEIFFDSEQEEGNTILDMLTDEKAITDKIAETENKLMVYQLCLEVLFKLKSPKPYQILGFCFNVLILGVESDHVQRGCSSHTAEAIADELLKDLRDKFCGYSKDYRSPVPTNIIAPFNERLKDEHNGKTYELHIPRTFYRKDHAATISDWTYKTKKKLLEQLLKEPRIIEFFGGN